jgi:hypothetical protein
MRPGDNYQHLVGLVREAKIVGLAEAVLMNNMRLTDSNPGGLMTNPEREMGRTVKNPEATRVSDEEVQEAN